LGVTALISGIDSPGGVATSYGILRDDLVGVLNIVDVLVPR
jgi:hypothetical protein